MKPSQHSNSSDASNNKGKSCPAHLISLPGGLYGVWPWVCVRSAGFPARMVLDVAASPELIGTADTVLQAEDTVEQTRKLAIAELKAQLEQAPKKECTPLQKIFRQIKNKRLPSLSNIQLPILKQLHQAQQDLESLRAVFEQTMAQDACRINQAIRDILRNETFQEAMIWQNRRAFQRHCGWFLQQPASRTNYRIRDIERLLANYLQRYCVKNDTIGFFGPVGWGKLITDSWQGQNQEHSEEPIAYQPGEHLITNRQVFFEQWALDALAERLSQQEEFRPWLPPCPLPSFYLEGMMLHLPVIAAWLREGKIPSGLVKSSFPLSPIQYRVLQLCDGKRPAKEIALEILNDLAFNLMDETEVYQLLEQFCDLGVLRWTLNLPLGLHPEDTLRGRLERIGDKHLRQAALSELNTLETTKNTVAEVAGDPGQLNQALQELEDTFTRLTGVSPTRAEGQFYAGRTLVYEDCRRDMILTFGPDILNKLGSPLSLLLTSARWFTYQVAQAYREAFNTIYERLGQECGGMQIDLQSFFTHALSLLGDDRNSLLTAIIQQLQQQWMDIFLRQSHLHSLETQKFLNYSSEELFPYVQAVFDTPHSGWNLARYRAPDILIAAANVEDIQQDNYQLILGELHLCNTIDNAFIVAQHPCPEELRQMYEQDIAAPCVIPVVSKTWSSQRNLSVLSLSKDIRVAFESVPSNFPRSQVVTLGELIVERVDGSLQVCTRDHRFRWDMIEFFGYTLSTQSIAFPSILPAVQHSPRITIDDLIVCRESWNFDPAELPFAQSSARSDLLLVVRRWVKEHGIPRFVFVKATNEPKPFFVDLESSVYVDILAKTVRQQTTNTGSDGAIRITEMLPDFEHLWLFDAAGNRYTSELRFVMLDGKN